MSDFNFKHVDLLTVEQLAEILANRKSVRFLLVWEERDDGQEVGLPKVTGGGGLLHVRALAEWAHNLLESDWRKTISAIQNPPEGGNDTEEEEEE